MRLAVRVAVACLFVWTMAACSGDAIPDEAKFEGVAAELWRGPDHCDWDKTHFLVVQEDLPGFDITKTSESSWHMFVRDPDEIPEYSYVADVDPDRVLPEDAGKLGENHDGSIELWYAESDPHFLYVVGEGFIEAWVRATDWGLCA